jgi:hypothetical protein
MILTHAASQGLLLIHQHLQAADILRTLRNAVVGFLAVVFILGGIVGFLIGRLFGRR